MGMPARLVSNETCQPNSSFVLSQLLQLFHHPFPPYQLQTLLHMSSALPTPVNSEVPHAAVIFKTVQQARAIDQILKKTHKKFFFYPLETKITARWCFPRNAIYQKYKETLSFIPLTTCWAFGRPFPLNSALLTTNSFLSASQHKLCLQSAFFRLLKPSSINEDSLWVLKWPLWTVRNSLRVL